MAASAFTKSCRRKLWFFRILDWVCLSLPLLIYLIIALENDGIKVSQKVAVVGTLIVAIILTILNVIGQKRLRCPIWIIYCYKRSIIASCYYSCYSFCIRRFFNTNYSSLSHKNIIIKNNRSKIRG